jgi:hypothetical protein
MPETCRAITPSTIKFYIVASSWFFHSLMLLVYYAQYCNSVVVELCAVEESVHFAHNSFPLFENFCHSIHQLCINHHLCYVLCLLEEHVSVEF